MRCSLNLLLPVIILAAPAVALAQSQPRFNVGTPLSQQEIKSFDFMVGPEGKELPPGHGNPKEGAAVFAKRCQRLARLCNVAGFQRRVERPNIGPTPFCWT